ncbi:MAG TPA: ATP-binding protein [Gemmatimonadaceae bacterium]|nr:ATP-binding protein [Gemmatimonadaceae bacterium]
MPPRRRSIRLRLTVWYVGTIVLLFLFNAVVLRTLLRRTARDEFERRLTSTATLVRGFFRAELEEYVTVEATLRHIAGDVVFSDQALDFRRPDATRFVAVDARAPATARPVRLVPPVYTLTVPLDRELAPGWTVRIRGSASGLHRQLRMIDLSLLAGFPVLLALASGAGWWLTGRTLKPVGEMARAAERITPAHPSERLPIAHPGDELGRLGTHFNALLDRLDSALAQQRRFIADAAHELRTPIARMSSAVELALSRDGEEADAARARDEALAQIGADLRRTAQLVDELLQLARADAGERAPRLERLFLDDLVVDAVGPWRGVAEKHGVMLSLSEVEEAPAVLDPVLVHRLVGILVDNAIRYTGAGGAVHVRVHRRNGTAVLEVEDSGIGISDADRARLFERFYRGPTARRLAPEGSGLGLAIAHWIAARHGGSIELLPAGSVGTIARVVIPGA